MGYNMYLKTFSNFLFTFIKISKKLVFSLILFSLILLLFSSSFAQDTSKSSSTKFEQTLFEPLDEEISEVELPETQDEKSLGISISPRFEDFITRDTIRLRNRIQYGITDNLEIRTEIVAYSGNFIKNNWDTGIANGLIGLKYKFKTWPNFANIRSSTGINVRFPLGSPPKEIFGQYTSYSPYIVFARFLNSLPQVETFFNAQMNIVSNTPFRGDTSEKRPDNSIGLTFGGVYYSSKSLRYSLDLSYRTTKITGGDDESLFITPGIYWNIPTNYTRFAPGTWQIAAGVEIPITKEDENYTIYTRIKWNFDFYRKTIRFIKNKEE